MVLLLEQVLKLLHTQVEVIFFHERLFFIDLLICCHCLSRVILVLFVGFQVLFINVRITTYQRFFI